MSYAVIAPVLSALVCYCFGYWMAHRAQGRKLAAAWQRFDQLRQAYQNLLNQRRRSL